MQICADSGWKLYVPSLISNALCSRFHSLSQGSLVDQPIQWPLDQFMICLVGYKTELANGAIFPDTNDCSFLPIVQWELSTPSSPLKYRLFICSCLALDCVAIAIEHPMEQYQQSQCNRLSLKS